MLGVVVPAHDEEDRLGACLASICIAARCPQLQGEEVLIVVALDDCRDQTRAVARSWGAATVSLRSRNVGIARARGARRALAAGARWLAFTDADSVVGPQWLSAQLAQRTDAVCGTVEVRDWGEYGERLRRQHNETYVDADGHRHVHGANLGVTAAAYASVGGFEPLASSEDVALVDALRRHGASIAWSAAPRVVTSARRHYRAPGGFGETLARVERELAAANPRSRSNELFDQGAGPEFGELHTHPLPRYTIDSQDVALVTYKDGVHDAVNRSQKTLVQAGRHPVGVMDFQSFGERSGHEFLGGCVMKG